MDTLARGVSKPSHRLYGSTLISRKSELAVRLADAREVTHGIWPKTIAVHFVQGKS